MASWKLRLSNLQHSWKEFCQLNWQERWLLLQAFVFLPVIATGLHFMNFKRIHAILVRFSSVPSGVNNDKAQQPASVTTRLVQAAAARFPFKISCLVRSTTLWYLLRRQGIASEIRIGVSRQEKDFHAHAWVEQDGVVLNDRADIHEQFAAFEQITLPKGTGRA